MSAKVFISYRRDDSAGHAGRVHDRLEREFGRDLLFMDVDAIPLGANFAKVLGDEVGKCDVLLAVIGPGWLDARDEDGQCRLDTPHDFVRIEIAAALKRDIPVIPILLEGTRMPKAVQLPDDLKDLTLRNGLDVRHASFHGDMDKLVRGLKGVETRSTTTTPSVEQRHRADGRVFVPARSVQGAPKGDGGGWFLPGNGKTEWFKDHDAGPEMVVVPAGTFLMGSPESEPERESLQKGTESPQHLVTISKEFAIGRCAVTVDEFAAFVSATRHAMPDAIYTYENDKWELRQGRSWRSPGFVQTGRHPVVGVSWDDAVAYVGWLAKVTGQPYRLLAEAEWEYAARAMSTTPFWWGSSITVAHANYDGNFVYAGGGSKGTWRKATLPVDTTQEQFAPNPWGLHQVHGNVWEWCQDHWHDTYGGAPVDGAAWTQGGEEGRRVVRGGSWYDVPQDLRSAVRDWLTADDRFSSLGFRVGRTLTP